MVHHITRKLIKLHGVDPINRSVDKEYVDSVFVMVPGFAVGKNKLGIGYCKQVCNEYVVGPLVNSLDWAGLVS